MKRETMLAKLVLAEELLRDASGKPSEAIRNSLEHVIAVVRALIGEPPAGTATGEQQLESHNTRQ